MRLDDLDHRLIALLRTNARLPIAKLAASLNVTRATIKARLERLVGDGAIAGFTIVARKHDDAGGVRASLMVLVDGKQGDIVIRRLAGIPEIHEIYSTVGRWDIVAEIKAPSVPALDEILRTIRRIEGISTTETSILLAVHKSVALPSV